MVLELDLLRVEVIVEIMLDAPGLLVAEEENDVFVTARTFHFRDNDMMDLEDRRKNREDVLSILRF